VELTEKIANFNNLSLSNETVASELIVLCEGIKGNITKFERLQRSFGVDMEIDSQATTASSSSLKNTLTYEGENKPKVNSDHYRIEGLDDIDLKKSSIINFDFDSSLNWFEGIKGLQKLAICIILGKGLLISALSGIISIYYGDYLIEKFDLVKKYPRLARFIEIRKNTRNITYT